MMRLLSIGIGLYLSLVSVLPTTVWEECAKLPELYHHYQLHRLEEPDHSFSDFLAEHYGDEGDHHASHHDHARIPFNASHPGTDAGWHTLYLPGASYWADMLCCCLVAASEAGFSHALACLPEPLLPFWQPPKLS